MGFDHHDNSLIFALWAARRGRSRTRIATFSPEQDKLSQGCASLATPPQANDTDGFHLSGQCSERAKPYNLRAAVRKRLGARFRPPLFHHRAPERGVVTLDDLARCVESWDGG
jgi:hypothetical protein